MKSCNLFVVTFGFAIIGCSGSDSNSPSGAGGSTSGIGGSATTGGTPADGNAATGGAQTGGAANTGGNATGGNAVATGGNSPQTGGVAPTGGSKSTGGAPSTGVPPANAESARDKFVATNHCSSTTTAVNPSPCVSYDGCDSGYPVVWCLIAGEGHAIWSQSGPAIATFFQQF